MERSRLGWVAFGATVAVVAVFTGHLRLIKPRLARNNERCTVERFNRPLGCTEFVAEYMGQAPVIFPTMQQPAQFAYAKEQLLKEHGGLLVSLSTANTYTGRKRQEATLAEYILQQERNALSRDEEQRNGSEVFYLFGGTRGKDWDRLLEIYHEPALPSESILAVSVEAENLGETVCSLLQKLEGGSSSKHVNQRLEALGLPTRYVSKTFGLAGQDTGVPFHFHGPGFNEVIHGAKRWFLTPPGAEPPFDPNVTTAFWTREILPDLPPAARPLQCDLSPGEALYFPSGWYHATLNLEPYTVWVATFA